MKALLFGVSGFVGSYLVKELNAHGYQVYGTDLTPACDVSDLEGYISCDLIDQIQTRAVIETVRPDCIVNLAAVSSVGLSWSIPAKTTQINVCGCIHIFESVREIVPSCRILLIGSSEEYVPSDKPLSEDCPLQANNPYGISKTAMEQFASLYREQYGLKVYQVRAFNHTGIGQRDTFVLPGWCRQVAQIEKTGKPGVIHVGNLDVARDFSDVRDIVRAYRMVLESSDCGQVYNIGSGIAWNLKALLEEILTFSSLPIEVHVDPSKVRATDNPVICCNNSKIRNIIGWQPSHDIKETLKEMFDWYMQQ